jgi:hypothetical protein
MSSTSAVMASPAPRAAWQKDFGLALLATLIALAVNAIGGFQSLNSASDNDSLLRLVEVRDMLAGQNWFDLHQYRMGPEGGFVMHWSRLVDAPLAAIILAISAITGSMATAETTARIAWPALMFGLTVFFTIRAARRFGGDSAALPALITSAAGLHFLGIYSPGALDHHNIQLMLTMASISFLLAAPLQKAAATLSGICAALTLAIGMETAPYVAVIGLCVAGLFTFGESGERLVARDYGLGFAGTAVLVFAFTVAPSEWAHAQCDAFSSFQFVLAGLAGAGLAAIASTDFACQSRRRRLAALAVLGAGLAAVTLRWFPECLAAPYAALDPRLREFWLDHVSEAQSMFQLIKDKDASVVARYVTPVIALVLMAHHLRSGAWRRQDSVVGTVLVAAFIVSVWQVRGSTFSIALAVIPLSAWIGTWRERAETAPTPAVSLKMIAVWLVSLNAAWVGAAAATSLAIENGAKAGADAAGVANCESAADFAQLASEPDTTVLAPSDLGAPILAYSGHRALAGPYHRNIAGNLLVLDAFMGTDDKARAVIESHHVGMVAFCPGSAENRLLVDGAPDGFLAQLTRGTVPAWLEPIAETRGKPLELYRVKQGG